MRTTRIDEINGKGKKFEICHWQETSWNFPRSVSIVRKIHIVSNARALVDDTEKLKFCKMKRGKINYQCDKNYVK